MEFNIDLEKGIDPFYFGESIQELLSLYPHNFVESPDDEMWDEYDFFDNTIEVYVDKKTKLIESICCRDNCYLSEQNLIGLDIDKFFELFQYSKETAKVETISLTEEDQDVYDLEGLQLWVNEENKIVTVFVSSFWETE